MLHDNDTSLNVITSFHPKNFEFEFVKYYITHRI